jgi:hypothetical protein
MHDRGRPAPVLPDLAGRCRIGRTAALPQRERTLHGDGWGLRVCLCVPAHCPRKDLHAGPRLEAWGTAGLERAAQHGPIFVDGTEESVRYVGAQRDAVSLGHLHEALRLRLSADARRDLTDRRGHQLGRSCRAQPRGVVREDLHVVALSKTAGTAGRAVVRFAQGPNTNRDASPVRRALRQALRPPPALAGH